MLSYYRPVLARKDARFLSQRLHSETPVQIFSKAWQLKLYVEVETVGTADELVSYSHYFQVPWGNCVITFRFHVYSMGGVFCHDAVYDIVSESIN